MFSIITPVYIESKYIQGKQLYTCQYSAFRPILLELHTGGLNRLYCTKNTEYYQKQKLLFNVDTHMTN